MNSPHIFVIVATLALSLAAQTHKTPQQPTDWPAKREL